MDRRTAIAVLSVCVAGQLDKKLVAETFVGILSTYNSVYHFDVSAADIVTRYGFPDEKKLFSAEEAKACDIIRDYCYSDYLFELALKAR